jgi:hypothetical protein
LVQQLSELQTWLNDAAHFDTVEHLQIGRMLALEAEARQPAPVFPRFRLRALALFIYAIAALGFAWLLVAERL